MWLPRTNLILRVVVTFMYIVQNKQLSWFNQVNPVFHPCSYVAGSHEVGSEQQDLLVSSGCCWVQTIN